jgi:hypothetical protein
MPQGTNKQVSLYFPLDEWKAIRQEAARLNIPITDLVRGWMKPELNRLLRGPSADDDLDE